MRTKLFLFLSVAAAVAHGQNAVQVASYLFQGNFNSQRNASAPLIAVNPSGRSSFVTDTVFGQSRTVYDIQGADAPKDAQGGLTYSAKDKVARDLYSVELVIAPSGTGWRRIFDVQNRWFSEGLYLDPSSQLDYYSGVATGVAGRMVNGTYYHVVLVKRPGDIALYLNGTRVGFRAGGTLLGAMNAVQNPDMLMHILLDDGTGEWAPARVALFRVYSGALTDAQITEIARSPFTSVVGVPPPGFQSSGIVNSASFSSGNAISPGGFFTIFGTDLSMDTADWGQSFVNNVAPRRLNNVRVLINDQEAFVVFISPGQVNALAPDNIAEGPVTVVVENSTVRSAVVPSTSRRINPAVFRFNPQNSRYLASTANDGSAYIAPPNLFGTNGSLSGLAVRPARPGEYVVLYATALGPTTPSVPAGQIPPPRDGAYPLSNASQVRLTASNGTVTTVTPAYAGLSGFPGLQQVVFLVPDVPNGEYETVLVVAGQASPNGTFLPIGR